MTMMPCPIPSRVWSPKWPINSGPNKLIFYPWRPPPKRLTIVIILG
jgi:hypothetical protein